MTPLHSILLGAVEGVTEFLPISSTGHLILASSLLGLSQTEFQKSFEIIIQLGAIASVVAVYWRSFLNVRILKRVAIAFLPTGLIGLALYKVIKTYLLGNETVVLWAMLLGGVVLIAFEYFHREKADAVREISAMSWRQAALIGVFQSVAIVPGVSRSAASIIGGLGLGLTRVAIVEFSFLLAVPTMLAATGLDLLKNASAFSPDQFGILAAGFATSFVVALFSIKFLLRFVRTRTFVPFGVYRIIAALLFFFFVLK
ncbi:MAG TPA: undecaprenyl-diphosphate phosphatase [Candidatus Paceibacterota bacterium]|nr:undecaprenyl-diphosphate phosphatase [Candidatus Paceibacterota bacterium]